MISRSRSALLVGGLLALCGNANGQARPDKVGGAARAGDGAKLAAAGGNGAVADAPEVAPGRGATSDARVAAEAASGAATSASGAAAAAAGAAVNANGAAAAANGAANEAKNAAADAGKAAQAAQESNLDRMRSGKLIEYGVTAGYAAAIELASAFGDGTAGVRQESGAFTTMPYVAVVPGYLFDSNDIRKSYCATTFGSDAATATEVAKARVLKQVLANLSPSDRQKYDSGDSTVKDNVDRSVQAMWESTKLNCIWKRGGIWVGRPLSYDASVIPRTNVEQQKLQVESEVAFGVAWMPNSYVTLMVGLSYNHIKAPAVAATETTTAQPERLNRFVTPLLGFGGNLDIITAALK